MYVWPISVFSMICNSVTEVIRYGMYETSKNSVIKFTKIWIMKATTSNAKPEL